MGTLSKLFCDAHRLVPCRVQQAPCLCIGISNLSKGLQALNLGPEQGNCTLLFLTRGFQRGDRRRLAPHLFCLQEKPDPGCQGRKNQRRGQDLQL